MQPETHFSHKTQQNRDKSLETKYHSLPSEMLLPLIILKSMIPLLMENELGIPLRYGAYRFSNGTIKKVFVRAPWCKIKRGCYKSERVAKRVHSFLLDLFIYSLIVF